MSSTHLRALAYAVRPRVVARHLGQLGLVIAALTAVPMVVAVLAGEEQAALRYLLVVAGLIITGLGASRLAPSRNLQTNEALVITTLAFVITALLMSYCLMEAGLSFADALFESVSGVTTTGLSVLYPVQDLPAHVLFARAWMQWYGGLGIVILGLAVLVGRGEAARRLAAGADHEDMLSSTRAHARGVLMVYGTLTLLAVGALWAVTGRLWPALLHALTAVSTGGFSSYDNSIAGLGPWPAQSVAIGAALTGAVPLALYYQARQRGAAVLTGDLEVRGLLAAFVLIGVALTLCLVLCQGMPWPDAIRHGWLLGLSAQSGTGFSSMTVSELDAPAQVLLMGSMLIGGGTGSTAGGIKILRLLILLRLIQLYVARTALPSHAVVDSGLGDKRLQGPELERALIILPVFLVTVFVSWLAFLVEGHAPLASLFDVISAVATVGLSAGVTGPDLDTGLKYLLSFDMLLGRLEILAFLVLLAPGTWFGKRMN